VVHPCFIASENPLQESLSFFTVLLQKLHARFLACLFVLICNLLWHPPCTTFMMPKVLVDDGIYRCTTNVQLIGCISDSNISLEPEHELLTLSTGHKVVGWPEWSSSVMFVLPFWNLSTHPLVHFPLCNTFFFVLCQHSPVNLGGFYPF